MKTCQRCGKQYNAEHRHKRGQGSKYCSQKCARAVMHKKERNAEIYRRYMAGEKKVDIARDHGIGCQRVSDIIRMIRKRQEDPPAPKRARSTKPPKPAPRRTRPRRRDPTYMRELRRRQKGGDRYRLMWRTERPYTRGHNGDIYRPMFGSRRAAV